MPKLRTYAFTVLLAACGSSSKPAPTTPTTPPPATAPAAGAQLGITELKFYQGDKMMLHLLADGSLQVLVPDAQNPAGTWKTVGTITADGKITGPDGKSAQVQPDGSVTLSDGKAPDFKLEGDALVIDGKRVTLDPTGVVQVDGQPISKDTSVRIEGATDAATRRTALLLIGLTLGGEAHADEGGVEEK
jgi:hypothetical protein